MNRPLLIATLLLCFVGLLFLYSASPNRAFTLKGNFALKQFLWMVFAFFIFWRVLSVDYKRFYDLAYVLYGVNLFLLVLVLILGKATRLGAQRWLAIGPFAFQPSEFLKITFVLAIARFLSGRDLEFSERKIVLISLGLTVIPAFLILKEPHLGTALILFPILFSLLYVAGLRKDFFLWVFFLGILLGPLGWFFLKEYQRSRLLIFVNPNLDPLGAGYSVIQSRISIGSGWLFGKGYLSGTQTQLNFLPERHTDFIFSVIGEEWGFIGAAAVIFLYFFMVKKGIEIAARSREDFVRLTAAGLTTMLAGHIFVNIAMTMGFLPVVGLPLPFISYGGSWLTTCLVTVAILLNIGREKEF